MNLIEILQNPAGKGSRFLSSREEIRKTLHNKYLALLTMHKKFFVRVYNLKNIYFYYFRIPSEKYDVYYEVIIKIENIKDTIADGQVSVFSNSPSFTFTYAYVVNKDGFLVSELRTKVARKALTMKPTITNTVEIFGFEKSIHFALLYLRDLDMYKASGLKDLEVSSNKADLLNMLKNVLSSEEKLAQYNKVKRAAVSKQKKQNKQKKRE
jgi:hypothetical protein